MIFSERIISFTRRLAFGKVKDALFIFKKYFIEIKVTDFDSFIGSVKKVKK